MLSKIGKMLKVVAIIETVLIVLFALARFVEECGGYSGVLGALIVAAVYLVLGFLGAVSLYGLGEMMVTMDYITDKVYGLEDIRSRLDAIEEKEKPLLEGCWKCPDCGKNNPSYTGTCGCGRMKP